jgi:rSAM/selenodomain-associated transferase 2/rSAM/selenodomain-associated transferase 1
MTRIPEAGRVKTRLIPALGSQGAAQLHHALLARTLRVAETHAVQADDVSVEVRFTGGPAFPVDRLPCQRVSLLRKQQGTDLGSRMYSAVEAAFVEGVAGVLVMGADCPDLSPEMLSHGWRLLQQHDVVLGPADDGGYYLIGMKQPDARLFSDIDWGTDRVLTQTRQRCRERGKSVGLLPALTDVDAAENLVVCRRARGDFESCLPQVRAGWLSIVIPTWNEARQIEDTVRAIGQPPDCEVVVSDGGSTDGTTELARALGCRVVHANRGRGRQLNAGAALAHGEYLLFLHADTRVPPTFRDDLRSTLAAGAIAGAFRFQIALPGWGMRCVEWGTNLRAKVLQLPYGDQGLFVRAHDFFRLGGFRNWPLMEDVEMCGRLKREGCIGLAPTAAVTSGRRWKRMGALRNTLVNQFCLALYLSGVSPERIFALYATADSPFP